MLLQGLLKQQIHFSMLLSSFVATLRSTSSATWNPRLNSQGARLDSAAAVMVLTAKPTGCPRAKAMSLFLGAEIMPCEKTGGSRLVGSETGRELPSHGIQLHLRREGETG